MNTPAADELLLAIPMPGAGELVLILLIVVVVFGANRLPQLGDALGKGIKNFRKAFSKDELETTAQRREVAELTDQKSQAVGAKLAETAKREDEVGTPQT